MNILFCHLACGGKNPVKTGDTSTTINQYQPEKAGCLKQQSVSVLSSLVQKEFPFSEKMPRFPGLENRQVFIYKGIMKHIIVP